MTQSVYTFFVPAQIKRRLIIKANRGFGPGFCEIGAKFGCGTHVKDLQKQNNINN